MSSIEHYNFPAFEEAADTLREIGYEVISPAEMDKAEGIEPSETGDGLSDEAYAEFLARDIRVIAAADIDAIVVLPGWEASGGAKTEVAFSRALKADVLSYPELEHVHERSPLIRGLVPDDFTDCVEVFDSEPPGYVYGEIRVTNEKTGGQKGSKPERFDLLPWAELTQVAALYGAGAEKYAPRNWERGYDWHLSFASLMRHAAQFWNGEELDAETKQPHLASVVFHALALMYFTTHHPELDDRPEAP